MAEFQYFYHGLRISCEFDLPEWTLFARNESGWLPDVVISIGEKAAESEGPPTPANYEFFADGAGWFQVKQGARIVLAPVALPVDRKTRLFLIGSAWGALLYQRELLPVHGSAIQTDQGAVLFCGRRGQGKSTLAACLTERGFRLVSDDLCCVKPSRSGPPLLYPSLPRFKLWTDSIRMLGWSLTEPEQDEARTDKFHYFRPSQAAYGVLPVACIYLLSWGAPSINRLTGFGALHRYLNAATWRGDLLLAAGNPAAYFGASTALIRSIPVWSFRRAKELTSLVESADVLISHLLQNKE